MASLIDLNRSRNNCPAVSLIENVMSCWFVFRLFVMTKSISAVMRRTEGIPVENEENKT